MTKKGWKMHMAGLATRLEARIEALNVRLVRGETPQRNVVILPYRGFGNDSRIYLKGRVLRNPRLRPVRQTDRVWNNVLRTYRRLNSVEIPQTPLQVRYGTEVEEIATDEEGYFQVYLENRSEQPQNGWVEIDLKLMNETADGEPICAKGFALIPPPSAKFGVISDIDDTVVVSHARQLLRMAYTVLLREARARIPFEGVGAFYRALHAGATGTEENPIFYVSSGPWNLYDLLLDFLEINKIPVGPVLLQDYGLDQDKLLYSSHSVHKLEQIRRILEMYPEMPFVLIGDSGQHDPEIYRKVLEETPNRIKAIYIRNVTDSAREKEIAKLAAEAHQHGGELLLVRDSMAAAIHAESIGLIAKSSLAEIAGEVEADKSVEPLAVEEPK